MRDRFDHDNHWDGPEKMINQISIATHLNEDMAPPSPFDGLGIRAPRKCKECKKMFPSLYTLVKCIDHEGNKLEEITN